eukprot:CAMPEP_0194510978 /NCGR_PEP_ID=MMETSP0253-20130528/42502_1 /TAXON_ID=2966 /ORGANISM="Noctiluca scintillans" /LENGTH=108 /DNA_ID=CAMNT_0039354273 /DNA_START=85 /DNA_END=408 /DNA_ORIENTATION=+
MAPTIKQHMSYIQEKMNPIMEAMVTALLMKCPESVEEFMLTWLLEQDTYDRGEYGQVDSAELERLRKEIESLKTEKEELQEALHRKSSREHDDVLALETQQPELQVQA